MLLELAILVSVSTPTSASSDSAMTLPGAGVTLAAIDRESPAWPITLPADAPSSDPCPGVAFKSPMFAKSGGASGSGGSGSSKGSSTANRGAAGYQSTGEGGYRSSGEGGYHGTSPGDKSPNLDPPNQVPTLRTTPPASPRTTPPSP